MNTPKEIGAHLKQIRKVTNTTRAEVAERIGIKPVTYTQFETGRTNMTLSTLNRIASALGCEVSVSITPIKVH